MKSLREFLGLCAHTWVIDDERDLLSKKAYLQYGKQAVIGKVVYLRCTKCGKYKRKEMA